MQSKQSAIARKNDAKQGWVSKTYKMKKKIVEDFKDACDEAGVSQAGKLMEFMQQFIDEVSKEQ